MQSRRPKSKENYIHISFEETNRLREQLGLKPLYTNNNDRSNNPPKNRILFNETVDKDENKSKKKNDVSWDNWVNDLEIDSNVNNVEDNEEEQLKISHDVSDIVNEIGSTYSNGIILTLKDSSVLDDIDDGGNEIKSNSILENSDIRSKEKLSFQKKVSKKYNPYSGKDTEDVDILAQYDNEEDKVKLHSLKSITERLKKHNVEDDVLARTSNISSGRLSKMSGAARNLQYVDDSSLSVSEKLKHNLGSLLEDIGTDNKKESKFKKSKSTDKIKGKKKSRNIRKRDNDGSIFDEAKMQEDTDFKLMERSNAMNNIDGIDFENEDLENSLALQRRINLASLLKSKSGNDIIKEKMNYDSDESDDIIDYRTLGEEFDSNNGAITITDTSDFLFIANDFDIENIKTKKRIIPNISTSEPKEIPSLKRPREEDVDDSNDTPITSNVVDDESSIINKGLGSTVALLLKQGDIKKVTEEDLEKDKIALERQLWFQEYKKHEEKRNEIIQEDHGLRKNAIKALNKSKDSDKEKRFIREKEVLVKKLDAKLGQDAETRFNGFVPEIKLEYHDSHGRSLNPKEAFKELSRNFHGRFSGKNKTNKLLRKIELERKGI